MRRIAVLLIFAVACSREQKSDSPAPPPPPARPATLGAPPPPPPPVSGASPYVQAVEWFGRTSGFRFELTEGKLHVKGTLQRATPGSEIVKFDGTTGAWTGTARAAGVEWGPRPSPPPEAIRVWQRVTVFLDPQKREGEAQSAGDGRYRFTDSNTGSVYEVSLDALNRITRLTITPPVNLRDAFPPVTMSIAEPDRTVNSVTP